MTTLNGMISRLGENSMAMFESLGYISTNIANYNTTAFKAQRFDTYLNPDGSLEGTARTDYARGSMMVTLRPLDIAIDGAGFIPVTNKKGDTSYTREGSFAVDAKGYLVSSDGWMVADGIKIPPNYEKLKISPEGNVEILSKKGLEFKKVGKIPLVSFNNPEGLKILEGNKVVPTEKSGKACLITDHASIKQGKLEGSNIDIYAFVNETLKINGSLITSTKYLKFIDEIYRQSINLRQ